MTQFLYDRTVEMIKGLTDQELRKLKREIQIVLDMRKIKNDIDQGKVEF